MKIEEMQPIGSEGKPPATSEKPRNGPPSRDLGLFIANRRRGWAVRTIQSGFTLVFGILGLLLGFIAVMSLFRDPLRVTAIFCIMPATCLALAYFFALHVHVSIDFYERGLVWKWPLGRREAEYKDIVRLDYRVVRQYVNAIYTGTLVTIALYFNSGRKFRWVGRYKETPKGLAYTMFGREFEVHDRLDLAREIIAIHVADYLETELRSKGDVAWTKGAKILANGIIPAYGRRKGSIMTWGEITQIAEQRGFLQLFDGSSDKQVFAIPCAGRNYFPGLELVGRLSAAAGREVARASLESTVTRRAIF